MLSRKSIQLSNINPNHKQLYFHSPNDSFSFLKNTVYISIYYNDDITPRVEFFADKYITLSAQRSNVHFLYPLAEDVSRAKILFEMVRECDMSSITVELR